MAAIITNFHSMKTNENYFRFKSSGVSVAVKKQCVYKCVYVCETLGRVAIAHNSVFSRSRSILSLCCARCSIIFLAPWANSERAVAVFSVAMRHDIRLLFREALQNGKQLKNARGKRAIRGLDLLYFEFRADQKNHADATGSQGSREPLRATLMNELCAMVK